MSKVFVIDAAKCTGCYNCQLACKDEFVGNDFTPYSKPQPEIGQFWIRVDEQVMGTLPKVRVNYLPRLCNHCEKAACMEACPQKAIYRREDGLVLIDPETCSGCGKCRDACPYDVIYWNNTRNLAQKCTGCAHLLDNGHALPRCVEACPTEAIHFAEADALQDEIEGAQVQKPETGLHPRVYYRNLPGTFIGGTVYDPVSKEIVEGVRCLLANGGKTWSAVTDSFGDFWFQDLPIGIYELLLQAKGYESRRIEGIRNKNSVNLGDIPLKRA